MHADDKQWTFPEGQLAGWIAPNPDASAPISGVSRFTTKVKVPASVNLAALHIPFLASAFDEIVDVLVNGVSQGFSAPYPAYERESLGILSGRCFNHGENDVTIVVKTIEGKKLALRLRWGTAVEWLDSSGRERATSVPSIVACAVVTLGDRTDEGTLIEAVSLPWFEIVALLMKEPTTAFEIESRKWEEIIAGAYKRAGYDDVILTPRSGDYGRDVIAVKHGICTVRIIDQVKAYKPGHRVTADDVRALMGVLHHDGASKGCVTTTSDFAPGIWTDPLITPLMPTKLELVNGIQLLERLGKLARKK